MELGTRKACSIRFSKPQLDAMELLFQECPRPTLAFLEQIVRDHPLLSSLDVAFVRAWFHSRRLRERRDDAICPLIQKNAELKAEHQALLLENSQLKNKTVVLNMENKRLKQELQVQLQNSQHANLSSSEAGP